jgi:hypothetical protein
MDGRSGTAAATTAVLPLYTQQPTNVDVFETFNVNARSGCVHMQ